MVKNAGGNFTTLFTDAEYRSIVGRGFDNTYDFVMAMNGDYGANANTISGVNYQNGNLVAYTRDSAGTGLIRICYVIVARR